jgi:hypothetical protein
MVSERTQAKDRIRARRTSDPELDDALSDARVVADREQRNQLNKLDRSDKLHGHVNLLYILGVWIIGASIIASVAILIFHYAAPNNYRFLSPDEVSQLQNVLLSGTVGSGLTATARKIFG